MSRRSSSTPADRWHRRVGRKFFDLRINGRRRAEGKAAAGESELTGAYVQSQAGKIEIDLRDIKYPFDGPERRVRCAPQAPLAGTRFRMAGGAVLDVSGMFDVECRSRQLGRRRSTRQRAARSPLQRGGFLEARV